MGYRSDVAMFLGAQTPKDFDQFLVQFKLWHLAEFGPSLNDGLFMGWHESNYGFGEDCFIFHALDVKWYESYPEVQRIEMLWQFVKEYANEVDATKNKDFGHVEETHGKFEGRFIRIGEAVEDVQVEDFGWTEKWAAYGIGIRREIVIDDDRMPFGEVNLMLSGERNLVPTEKEEVK